MAIIHHIDKRQLLFLVIIGGLFLLGYIYRKNQTSQTEQTGLDKLDDKLLAELQYADISVTDDVACVMQCADLNTNALKPLFSRDNLDYSNCDFNNCHNLTYAITGKISGGKEVTFTLESGETGNRITHLELEEQDNCDCI